MISLPKVLEGGCFKWVCVNGEYRFTSPHGCHADLVKKGEKASGAGMIGVSDKWWESLMNYSQTLRVQMREEDNAGLTQTLGRPRKERT